MQDTEKYLNSILQKRLGSVPNHYGFKKDGYTVTRLAKKQQKLQSMPTVFRNKTQTIYRTTGVMPGEQQSKNPLLATSKQIQPPFLKKQDSGQNQRVEYVAISKRLQSKKQQIIAPSVDVTKYRRTQYIPPQQIKMDKQQIINSSQYSRNSQVPPQQITSNSQFNRNTQMSSAQFSQRISGNMVKQTDIILKQEEQRRMRTQVSRASQVSQGAKRRKIFGSSKEKY